MDYQALPLGCSALVGMSWSVLAQVNLAQVNLAQVQHCLLPKPAESLTAGQRCVEGPRLIGVIVLEAAVTDTVLFSGR